MPLFDTGIYIDNAEDRAYEVETTYQLKYYISSALLSINFVLEPMECVMGKFDNKVQYYRYYVDNLFYYVGLINDRFVCKAGHRDQDLQTKKQERVTLNQKNYQFNSSEFCVLSDKTPRNIIEHLDERNVKTMIEKQGVGGFNVILEDSDPAMVSAVTNQREFYPYNLDLVNKKVLFYNTQAKENDVKEIEIDILAVENELNTLLEHVNDFAEFLKLA